MPAALAAQQGAAPAPRPMTWLDMQSMRQVQVPVPSPDGKWAVYVTSTPDWKEARRQSDLHLVSLSQGIASARQLTFTAEKNETNPAWSRDGRFFVFLSDRDAPAGGGGAPRGSTLPTAGPGMQYPPPAAGGGMGGASSQLYLMRPDGGEARRITDAKDGVTTFAFSPDGKWLAYRSGIATQEQLFVLPVSTLLAGSPVAATPLLRHPTGVGLWRFSPDGRRIFYAAPDTVDGDERLRLEKRFDVRVRNAETPLYSLWALDVETQRTTRLTRDSTYSVGDMSLSPDGRWIGFHGLSTSRFERNILEQNGFADLYLLDVSSGVVERLTTNREIGESSVSFSPDSRLVAFSAPDDFIMRHNLRVYLREVAAKGAAFRKLGAGFDGPVTIGFWAPDGGTIYFNVGIKATDQVAALDIAANRVTPLTAEQASLRATQDDDTDRIFITRSDPRMPATIFAVPSSRAIAERGTWVQLTDANPWVRDRALGAAEEITWRGRDGTPVGGVLVKPVGYQAGTRYPLIVSIHGGPQSADVLTFNGGYGSQVYAGAGYMVLLPNYRNSTNYGQRFEIESQGDYFTKGYEDIMAGVDHLIRGGLVDSTRMGVLGWSAGGHWSNWILTHTTRFKAISTGAGVYNWISMYGESDTQRGRQWYLGDKMYWDDMLHWWKQSPAAYIRNAKTPTMIHVVDGDPRVPRPESEGLHMALKRLGVPTEFYVYPGNTHGIPDARNQLLKATAEMAWMDYWVRNSGHRFAWRDVLRTVEEPTPARPAAAVP
ncbi:MAG: S9 family peptidase [Gemmatimonadaceae bacterium]|nr:S9 family peptidase [Gemmatimonadaceae bacterium]